MSVKNIFTNSIKPALYLVPTPIGNIKDISSRAIEVLTEADIIASEDTRVTSDLLNKLGIKNKTLISCYSQNEKEKGKAIIEKIQKENLILAYCSDAGSPGISDPGGILCSLALEKDIAVIALPGPTAFVPALTVSGFDTSKFTFIGFLPIKDSAKEKMLKEYSSKDELLIVYEAPHRIKKTLETLKKVFGGERKIAISREISKRYENHIYGTLNEICAMEDFVEQGEFVIIIDKCQEKTLLDDEEILRLVKEKLEFGESLSQACRDIANEYDLPRNYVYKLCIKSKL
ncbi:MAG TPA: 16S rRNA (cytidine(1402)-2'-O)-methyltransferase [Firmicutes bacterium]|nr:16S rRNA (cytidine(1402)-2'-O)-methyltransferase [Bacillota bacterium]